MFDFSPGGKRRSRDDEIYAESEASAPRDEIDDADMSVSDEKPPKKEKSAKKVKKRKSKLFDDDETAPEGFDELFEELRKKRREIARERGVRAFQTFPDRTLEAIALARPVTREEALQVPGIGPSKAYNEFPAFVPIIERYR